MSFFLFIFCCVSERVRIALKKRGKTRSFSFFFKASYLLKVKQKEKAKPALICSFFVFFILLPYTST